MEQVRKHFILRGCLTILLVVFKKSSEQVQDVSRLLQFFSKTQKADWKSQLDFLLAHQYLTLDKGKGKEIKMMLLKNKSSHEFKGLIIEG
jgi:hypothetical protein